MTRSLQSRHEIALKIAETRSLDVQDLAGLLEIVAEDASADGTDPWWDPAVILVIHRLAFLSGALNADLDHLTFACQELVSMRRDAPLFLQLLVDGLDADPRRAAEYALEVERLLRHLAHHLGFHKTDYAIHIQPAGVDDAVAVLHASWLHLAVTARAQDRRRGLLYRRCNSSTDAAGGEVHVAAVDALCHPRQLAHMICRDLAVAPRKLDTA